MGNTAFQTTASDQFLLDTWAAEVESTRQRNLVFREVFADSKEVYGAGAGVRGFQNLFITRTTALNSGNARTKSEGNDNALTYDQQTDTKITLAVDQWVYQAIEVEDFADALSGFDIEDLYLNEMGEVIARDEDAAYAALVDNASNTSGVLGSDPTEDDLLAAMQSLNENDVPQEGRSWVFSEKAYARLHAQAKFTSAEYVSGRPIETANILELLGTPVRHSPGIEGTNAAGHDNGLIGPRFATYYRVGNMPRVRPVMAEDNLADKVSVSNIYGSIEVRDADGYWLKGA